MREIITEELIHEELLSLLAGDEISFIENEDCEIKISGAQFKFENCTTDEDKFVRDRYKFAKTVLKLNEEDFYNMIDIMDRYNNPEYFTNLEHRKG